MEINKETENFLELNENEGITYSNLWQTLKAMRGRKFVPLSSLLEKLDSPHTNELKST